MTRNKFILIMIMILTTLLFISCSLLPSKDHESENAAAEPTTQVEETMVSAQPTPTAENEEETVTASEEEEAPAAEETEEKPVSGLTPGSYAFSNSNVVRDIAVYNGVAHAATLGGMNAWNLSSGYVMHYTPLQGMKHISSFAAVVCELPEVRVIFGTQRGLSFYDPNTGLWENVSITPEDSLVDTSNITTLFCDSANQRLLIGYNGLGILDLTTGAFTHFTKDNGLSWNQVTDIAVTGKDIWVASGYNGIARISGETVTVFNKDSGMPDERAYAVASAPDGSLWVGASSGLIQYKNGTWTLFGKDTPAGLLDVYEIEIDTTGQIWAATAPIGAGTLCQFDPKTQACVVEITDSEGQAILALTLDEQNRPVFGTNHGLYVLDGSNLKVFKQESDQLTSNFVDSIAAAPDGLMWVGTDSGIQLLDPASPLTPWVTFKMAENPGMGGNWATDMAVAPDGSTWFAITNGNASHFREGVWTSVENLRSYDCVTVDAQGLVWFGDDSKGITVLDADGNPVMTLTTDEGLPSNRINALLADGDNVWIATDNGLAKYENGAVQVILDAANPGLSNKYIRSLALNPDGTLVIGTILGVSVYDGNQATIILHFADYKVQDWLTALAVDSTGATWVGTSNGLFHSTDQTQWTLMTTEDGLLTPSISSLYIDQYDALWIGGGGLLQIVP